MNSYNTRSFLTGVSNRTSILPEPSIDVYTTLCSCSRAHHSIDSKRTECQEKGPTWRYILLAWKIVVMGQWRKAADDVSGSSLWPLWSLIFRRVNNTRCHPMRSPRGLNLKIGRRSASSLDCLAFEMRDFTWTRGAALLLCSTISVDLENVHHKITTIQWSSFPLPEALLRPLYTQQVSLLGR